MLKTIVTFVLFSLLAGVFVSCASSTKEEDLTPPKAILESEIKAAAPALEENPTSAFRMLKDDAVLPTEDQLSDGSETSLGYSESGGGDATQDNAPTTTVKPPRIEPEDQLAPSE